jgi:curved DNA-binding protein CbpA
MITDRHFEILGVNRDSTSAEIKKAYRVEIKKWHPDKFQHEPEKLLEAIERAKHINEAFELLKNYGSPKLTNHPKRREFNDSKTSSMRTGKPVFHCVKIRSSQIWSVGYDAFTKILQVEFYEEGILHFYDVPEKLYTELMYAEVPEDHLSKNISGKYRSEKISKN